MIYLSVLFEVVSASLLHKFLFRNFLYVCVEQNPPSIPTLTVVRIACWLRQAAFVIDWHNFGFTLLALSLGSSHPFVKIHSWYASDFVGPKLGWFQPCFIFWKKKKKSLFSMASAANVLEHAGMNDDMGRRQMGTCV